MRSAEHAATHVASLWNRLTSSWADPDARLILSKATPVSLPARSPRLKLLRETQASLETLETHVETAAGARVAVQCQGVKLLAELADWVQRNPRLEVHGNVHMTPDRLWAMTGAGALSCKLYASLLSTVLNAVCEAKDEAIAAAAIQQLMDAPGKQSASIFVPLEGLVAGDCCSSFNCMNRLSKQKAHEHICWLGLANHLALHQH